MARAVRWAVWGLLFTTVGCSSSPSSPSAPSGNGSSVTIVSGATALTTTAYSPNPITIARGGSVTWVNRDSMSHTATSDTGAWDSGLMGPGASFTQTFQNSGSFSYHCTIHPGMIGTVTVQ